MNFSNSLASGEAEGFAVVCAAALYANVAISAKINSFLIYENVSINWNINQCEFIKKLQDFL